MAGEILRSYLSILRDGDINDPIAQGCGCMAETNTQLF